MDCHRKGTRRLADKIMIMFTDAEVSQSRIAQKLMQEKYLSPAYYLFSLHYTEMKATQITGNPSLSWTVCSTQQQREHQNTASRAVLWGGSAGHQLIPLTKGQ